MGDAVTLTVQNGLGLMRMGREHGNAINGALAEGLITACREVESREQIRGVLFAAKGKLFCPGLDLRDLSQLDREAMRLFVTRLNTAVQMLYSLSKPVVAALHGHAIAGGCVLALTADWRVLKQGALVGFSEVRVGVPFPFGVAMILREMIPRTHLEEVALFGRNYSDGEAIEAGLVHEVRPEEGFEAYCLQRLEELASRDLNALAITKRYLRSTTLERIQAADSRYVPEFLDSWFRPESQQRIRGVIERLRARDA